LAGKAGYESGLFRAHIGGIDLNVKIGFLL
jgi:hypothetical protein